jgi:hypothetical protein
MKKSIILFSAALIIGVVSMAQTTVKTEVPAQDQTRSRIHNQTMGPAQSQTSFQTQDRLKTRSQLHINDQTGTQTMSGTQNKKQLRSRIASGNNSSAGTVGARTQSSFNNPGTGSPLMMNRGVGAGKGPGRR